MIKYLKQLLEKFKSGTKKFKALCISLLILYVGIICVCVIPLEVDATAPGGVTSVTNVISIDSENSKGNIYTVSVYTNYKMSILEYWFAKLDKKQDIQLGESILYNYFTNSEQNNTNIYYKEQSIQDAIILAYSAAISNKYDVRLDYEYEGSKLLNIPQTLFETGLDDLITGDIITKVNNISITDEDDYNNFLEEACKEITVGESDLTLIVKNEALRENLEALYNAINTTKKSSFTFTVKRTVNNKEVEIEINPSFKMLTYIYCHLIFSSSDKAVQLSSPTYFSKYTIDYKNASPKIDIEKSTSVGPSGGLMQALAVYNAITEDDITHNLRILGTGTISLDGVVGAIGGEQQKVYTADLYSANVMFVPSYNYESANEAYEKIKNPTFSLVKVDTFDEALTYLKGLGEQNG